MDNRTPRLLRWAEVERMARTVAYRLAGWDNAAESREDWAVDAVARIWRAGGRHPDGVVIAPALAFRIARNAVIDGIRRTRRQTAALSDTDAAPDAYGTWLALLDAVAALESGDKVDAAVMAAIGLGVSQEEIAAVLGVSKARVSQRVRRARARVRRDSMTTTGTPEKPTPDSGQGGQAQPEQSPNYDPPVQKPIPDVNQPEQPADNQPEGGYDAPPKDKPQ